jgi:arylsulfatase A-like enzyme
VAKDNDARIEWTGQYSSSVALAIGCVFALSAGLLDIIVSVTRNPGGLADPFYVFPVMGATVIAAFLMYLAVWILVFVLIRFITRRRTMPFMMAFAAFGLTKLLLFDLVFNLSSLVDVVLDPSGYGLGDLILTGGLLLGVAAVVFVGVYYTAAFLSPRFTQRRFAAGFCMGLPFMLAAGGTVVWILSYRFTSFRDPGAQDVMLYGGGAMLGFALVFTLLRFSLVSQFILVLTLIAAMVSPAILLIPRDAEPTAQVDRVRPDGAPQHVLLLAVDTLRPDLLSFYGGNAVETPAMNRLAGDSVVFTDAVATAPWTLPTMASIMTGVSPFVHGADNAHDKLPATFDTLAERLQEKGYATGAIGYNPNLLESSQFTQGFQSYEFFPNATFAEHSLGASILALVFPDYWKGHATTTELTTSAIDWYRQHQEASSFLWLHYFDPHTPYSPPPRYQPEGQAPVGLDSNFDGPDIRQALLGYTGRTEEERRWIKDLYLGEVRYVDDEIERLLTELDNLGLYDDMLIVFVSDHGEEFWDHRLLEHGRTLYREMLNVVLAVKLPGATATDHVDTLVATECLAPTILDLCNIEYDAAKMTSQSLVPFWDEKAGAFEERPVISTAPLYFENRDAVTTPTMKYIYSYLTGVEELYDRSFDPNELHSIADVADDEIAAMQEIMTTHKNEARALRETFGLGEDDDENTTLDPTTEESLRALGYVD